MARRKQKTETIEVEEVGKIEDVLDDIAATKIPEPEETPEVSTIETNTDSEGVPFVVEDTPVVANYEGILPRNASRYIPPLR